MDFRKLNPFRDKSRDNIDPDYAAYYQTGNDNQRVTAAILGFVTLLAAMLLVLGIFLGGRWLYNRINGDNKEPVAVQTDNNSSSNGETGTSSTNTDKQPVPVSIVGDGNNDSSTGLRPGAPGTTGNSSTTSTSQTSSLPQTGPVETLPRTGVE